MMRRLPYNSPDFFSQLDKFCRSAVASEDISSTVSQVLSDIGHRGDEAVLDYTEKFDHVRLRADELRVESREIKAALRGLKPEFRKAVKIAVNSVEEFHKNCLPRAWSGRNLHGAEVGEHFYPIRRAGIYVPGGRVPLVSTVVMTVALARLAKVPEIVVATPPGRDGKINPGLLATMFLCGADEIYKMGGIQAIGGMAYGTLSIPPVDKIFGPGNAYVMEAKRQVYGRVGVDLLPGPSEVMVIADAKADPAYVAADLLAQAEHGTGKEKIYFVTLCDKLASEVLLEIKEQRPSLRHADAIANVLEKGGVLIKVDSLEEAVAVANHVAPEHLELQVETRYLKKLQRQINTAGAILLGSNTPTVLGDFTAGPSHTLPTGGSGRFFSGLRIEDFMRRSSFVRYTRKALKLAAPTVAAFSTLEELDAHGESLRIRLRKQDH